MVMSRRTMLWVCVIYFYLAFFFFFFCYCLAYSFFYFVCYFCLAVTDISEGPKATADPTMPTIPTSTVPITPTLIGPSSLLIFVFSSIKIFIIALISSLRSFFTGLCYTSCFLPSPSPVEVALTFRFENGSSFATILDSVSEVVAFFTRFNQAETNNLGPIKLMGCWVSLC